MEDLQFLVPTDEGNLVSRSGGRYILNHATRKLAGTVVNLTRNAKKPANVLSEGRGKSRSHGWREGRRRGGDVIRFACRILPIEAKVHESSSSRRVGTADSATGLSASP